jgi:hypothetical protein
MSLSMTSAVMPFGPLLAGADHGHVDLVLAAARDESLEPDDDVMVAVEHRLGLERGGVRSPTTARSGNSCRSSPS